MSWEWNGETCTKYLSGITGLLSKHLFPQKYADVPETILEAAREKGSAIHKALQTYITAGFVTDGFDELCQNFYGFCIANRITPFKSEALVTDYEKYATMVDLICEDGDFYDFKTTYTLDKSYLSWQLSICAFLAGETKNRLYGVHIRDNQFELVEVDRIPEEKIQQLFAAEASGTIYRDDAIATIDTEALVLLEQTFVSLKSQMDEIEEKRKTLSELVRTQMQERGIKSFETGGLLITDVADTTATTFDSKRFKAEHPEMAAQYEKATTKKGYLKITTKK
jgi:hypothetical protein